MARKEILDVLTKDKRLENRNVLDKLASDEVSANYTGADLSSVVRESALAAIRKGNKLIVNFYVNLKSIDNGRF